MRTRFQLTPYLLILPALLTLLLLFVYPIAWNGWLSVHEVTFRTFTQEWPFAGFDNYLVVLRDTIFPRQFVNSLWVTVIFVGGSVAGQFLLGLALAMALTSRIRGRNAFRMLIALPWILSELVVAYIWLYMYQPSGTVNNVDQFAEFWNQGGVDRWAEMQALAPYAYGRPSFPTWPQIGATITIMVHSVMFEDVDPEEAAATAQQTGVVEVLGWPAGTSVELHDDAGGSCEHSDLDWLFTAVTPGQQAADANGNGDVCSHVVLP